MIKKAHQPSIPNDSEPHNAVPQTLEALRALSIDIGKGRSDIHLGQKAKVVLSRLLEMRGDKALLSISSLSERLDVNPSTISRLARNLGYKSFGELQNILLSESFIPSGAFYTQHAQTALTAGNSNLSAQAARLCREQQANIERMIEGFDEAAYEVVISKLAEATRIRIHGARQFYAFSGFLTYGLGMIRADVSLLEPSLQGVAEGLAAMDKGDVLVVSSCEPYTKSVVRVAQAAYEAGIDVIAVTDRASSPLVSCASVSLFAPHESSFISNSMVGFFSLAECLINGCASRLGDQAHEALQERDAFIRALKIEL